MPRPIHHTVSSNRLRAADWSQPAFTRTWRTLSVLLGASGVACALMHWSVPASLLCVLALWAHAKRQASQD